MLALLGLSLARLFTDLGMGTVGEGLDCFAAIAFTPSMSCVTSAIIVAIKVCYIFDVKSGLISEICDY